MIRYSVRLIKHYENSSVFHNVQDYDFSIISVFKFRIIRKLRKFMNEWMFQGIIIYSVYIDDYKIKDDMILSYHHNKWNLNNDVIPDYLRSGITGFLTK